MLMISPYVRRLHLGAEVRALRAEAGLTADQLGKRIGRSRADISRLENGHVVDQADVISILEVLGVYGDRWTQVVTTAPAARANVSVVRFPPSDHSSAISPPAPSVPRYTPLTARSSKVISAPLSVTVSAASCMFFSITVMVAVAEPSAAGASFSPMRRARPEGSSVPSHSPSNSLVRRLGGGSFTLPSPARMSSNGASPCALDAVPDRVFPSAETLPLNFAGSGRLAA